SAMDSRDAQSTSYNPYTGAPNQPSHAMQAASVSAYDSPDPNSAPRHYDQTAPTYDHAAAAAVAAAGDPSAAVRQYAVAQPSFMSPRPYDPRYAVVDQRVAGSPGNVLVSPNGGYPMVSADPSTAMSFSASAGASGGPTGSVTGPGWRAEWYPSATTAGFPGTTPTGMLATSSVPTSGAGSAMAVGGPMMGSAGRMGREFPGNTVYSFVPIPGAQQQKRPRRRFEEIERIYKCGYNGCEKAYGTLNHLNAHVSMQNHGAKRTPEEFKETRKEWKARKKEEDARRKAEQEAVQQQQQQQQQQLQQQ
ncbi:uncharacterized protein V1516DRAFT_617121, partial [Lipomyces oligophaga]|uniref:uncharacterized protein n=1 Tax=Lipomyces oligophaga TaxID=45792 RepID=UPI0034CD88A1